jgi:signal transduction histidine kinase/DNA-binding response OmpR family regulator
MTGESILIVDDEPEVLDICAKILELDGYKAKGVPNGHKAIEAVRQEEFDLVLADIKMPGLDGLETVQAIREIDPNIAGIIMTGYGTMETAIEALRLGMEDFIVKPFSPEQLGEVVTSALGKRRLQRENVRLRALIPLYELSEAFLSVTNLQELLDQIVHVSREETGADRASLMLLSGAGETLTLQAAIGLPKDVVKGTTVKLGEGISGHVAQQREPLVLDGGAPPSKELRKLMKQDEISSAICIPMMVRDEFIGVLNLSKLGGDAHPFTQSDVELTSVLAGQAAIAVKNANLFEEIQQAYTELKKLDELKSEFINIAAHELRTPLAILLGYAALLEERADQTTRKHLQIIVHNAMRLKTLVTDMLNLRYLESGQMDLQVEELHLSDVVDLVVQDLGFLADEKHQELAIEMPRDLPPIWADKAKLQLILSNLVSNAIKFTPEGGSIEVEALMKEDELEVTVKDTGIGIPVEEYDRIFDRFYQIGDSLRRQHHGLGLGLAIVKGLVELHQGRIWVEGRVEQGSTFFFTISRHLAPQSQIH